MKKKFAYIVCAAGFCLLLSACKGVPDTLTDSQIVSLNSFSVKDIGFDGITMAALVSVKNEYSFPLPFPEIDWKVSVDENLLINGLVKYNRKMPALTNEPLEIPFTVNYPRFYSVFTNLKGDDEAKFRMDLSAAFNFPVVGVKRFDRRFSGTFPLIKMPAIYFSGVDFNNVSLTQVDLTLTWLVENKNAFNVVLDELHYDFQVNGATWTKGAAPRKFSLPARQTAVIPVNITINSLSMVRDIYTMVRNGRSASFRCIGEASLGGTVSLGGSRQESASATLKQLSLPFNFTGNTNFDNAHL